MMNQRPMARKAGLPEGSPAVLSQQIDDDGAPAKDCRNIDDD
jgi:hypothetical protein